MVNDPALNKKRPTSFRFRPDQEKDARILASKSRKKMSAWIESLIDKEITANEKFLAEVR